MIYTDASTIYLNTSIGLLLGVAIMTALHFFPQLRDSRAYLVALIVGWMGAIIAVVLTHPDEEIASRRFVDGTVNMIMAFMLYRIVRQRYERHGGNTKGITSCPRCGRRSDHGGEDRRID